MEIKNLSISYGSQTVINNASLSFYNGLNGIIGESGSGKSSILNALVHLIDATYDSYIVNDINLKEISKTQRSDFIRHNMTYISQKDNFISDLSCYENIKLQLKLLGKTIEDSAIEELLKKFNLPITESTYPNQLSGGERQKLAICIAMARDTQYILCDEMTASLDEDAKIEIINLLELLSKEYNKTVIITSHDKVVYERCLHLYKIENREIKEIKNELSDNTSTALKSSQTKLTKKDFKKYVSSKIDRQKWYYYLSTLIFGIVTGLCAFLIVLNISHETACARATNILERNELFVVNKHRYGELKLVYYEFNDKPVTDEQISQIEQIEHVESVYPYYECPTYDYIHNREGQNKIELIDENNEVTEINYTEMMAVIVPYYPEQHFSDKQYVYDKNNSSGVYLSNEFLSELNTCGGRFESLGYDRDSFKGMTMKMNFQVPVGYYTSTRWGGDYTGETFEYEATDPYYEEVEFNLPVSGMTDEAYHDFCTTCAIYIPYDYLEQLQKEALNKHIPADDEITWAANALYCFADDQKNLEEVSLGIRKVDNNFKAQNRFQRTSEHQASYNDMYMLSKISFVLVLCVGCILSYVYSMFYYKKNKTDYLLFRRLGITKKEIGQLFKNKAMIQSISNLIISIPVILILVNSVHAIGHFRITGTNIALLIVFDVAISIAVSILSITKEMISYDSN